MDAAGRELEEINAAKGDRTDAVKELLEHSRKWDETSAELRTCSVVLDLAASAAVRWAAERLVDATVDGNLTQDQYVVVREAFLAAARRDLGVAIQVKRRWWQRHSAPLADPRPPFFRPNVTVSDVPRFSDAGKGREAA